ncbi:dTDP-4-dehydrorhamnose reductase [Nodularia spumigena CS-584]|uniref:dTDP-4-dehydrorhamnose reductase n=1 Tax=Nodularia spumigena UHCC 0060 TaxID=3110300 RepID=A0ABU5US12_NODSP|nr:dTDP-4-dehydrorhamnose reductase [Nodularia spumigena]AHJ26533.1 dTDP-4-dehydrorhamnose reductase [Nodularia spumigena CCY9414]EAW42966.1 dTDP-6-deoxy-L-mannose-dehydrogenase [Nodularia spumigena CCY9414]MDB9303951.1 dTDP-4-dehydrorhamnose reductase [Nodularia spumigena CS-591/12]MDB9381426.1 dTDP-4-dehydrorhamnose reductase [Nodularia spumigena CS-584]MEA5524563.1 dTDP-4-dehydrorhamnose reductase [Nodularia spumigena UHCC 0143]
MNESILLLGSNGQVGQELEKILSPKHKIIPLARPKIDLTQPDNLRQIIREIQPQIIINAAAYTAVDKAETEPELATAINAKAPQIIAEESQKLGCFLIHFSTDYVFDGQQTRPYQETDRTNPLGVYGQTKRAGEIAIEQTHPHHIILRTAWVYGTFGKGNFVKTMLRLGKERSEIGVVTDQIGSPTWAQDIADAIAHIIPQLTPEIAGTYHYTNSGVISWYDFAVAIFAEAQHLGFPLTPPQVIPITTAEYPTLARRPAYPVLACGKISQLLGTYPPHWRQRLRLMLKDWFSKS